MPTALTGDATHVAVRLTEHLYITDVGNAAEVAETRFDEADLREIVKWILEFRQLLVRTR